MFRDCAQRKMIHSPRNQVRMGRRWTHLVPYLIGFVALIVLLCCTPGSVSSDSIFSFDRYYVDTNYGGNGRPGWVRSGDMDGDGDLDLVAGGGYALFIYENDGNSGGWTRYGNLDSTGQMGANGATLHDVDGDGDLDVVCAKYYNELGWWENPIPAGGQLSNTQWSFHKLGDTTWYLHDIIRGDLDQDGVAEEFVANLNEGYWDSPAEIVWLRPGPDPTQLWERHTIDPRNSGSNHNHAGLDTGDVDRDGHVDLAYAGGWYEAPDDPSGSWTWHPVADIYGISNSLLRDMDDDQDLDLVVSAGHHGSGVYWFAAPADPKGGTWTQNTVDGDIVHPECLAVLDLDDDDDLEVVTCDLDFDRWDQQVHNVYVLENLGGSSSWNKQNVAPNSFASHLLQMVDVNQDGQMDIISEGCGYSVVSYYENTTTGTLPTVATPEIHPNGGVFTPTISVSLTITTPDAFIYYTTDGAVPDTSSTMYTEPFTLTSSAMVRARGYRDGYDPSAVASAHFVKATGHTHYLPMILARRILQIVSEVLSSLFGDQAWVFGVSICPPSASKMVHGDKFSGSVGAVCAFHA